MIVTDHDLFIFLSNFALLLFTARTLGELMKRLGQATVMGELLAGLLLGPSLLGHFLPEFQFSLFGQGIVGHSLIQVISFLGMTLLLFTIGLETKLNQLIKVGKPALLASSLGLFGTLALVFPVAFLIPQEMRMDHVPTWIFACFFSISFGISAISILAKILTDLNIIKRDIGLTLLGAGISDDILGFTLLGILFTVLGTSAKLAGLLIILIKILLFFSLSLSIGVWLLRQIVIWLDNRSLNLGSHTSITFLVIVIFSLISDALGMHFLLGAFIAGVIMNSIPRISPKALHNIESMTQSIFSPIFFSTVGLQVNIWDFHAWGILALVIFLIFMGKSLGVFAGVKLAKGNTLEAITLALGMNARGGMGLIIALVALQHNYISQDIYSLIVLGSMSTTILTLPFLKVFLKKIKPTQKELERIARDREQEAAFFTTEHLKLLIPTSGGPNAYKAIQIAMPLGFYEDTSITTLYIQKKREILSKFLFWRKKQLGPAEKQFRYAKTLAKEYQARVNNTRLTSKVESIQDMILKEALERYHILFLGASESAHSDAGLNYLLTESPCHIALVKARDENPLHQNILVLTAGDFYSKLAVEFALLYAEAVAASVTLMHIYHPRSLPTEEEKNPSNMSHLEKILLDQNIPKYKKLSIPINVKIIIAEDHLAGIVNESKNFDLLIMGAENRSTQAKLFLGSGSEFIFDHAHCSIVAMIPK